MRLMETEETKKDTKPLEEEVRDGEETKDVKETKEAAETETDVKGEEGLNPPQKKKPKKVKDKEKIRQRKRERRQNKSSNAGGAGGDSTTQQSNEEQQQQEKEKEKAAAQNPFQQYLERERSTNEFRQLIENDTVFHEFLAMNAEEALYLKIPNIRNFLKWLFIPEEFSSPNSIFKWAHPVPPQFSRVIMIAANSFPSYLSEGLTDLFINTRFQAHCDVMSPGDKIRIYPTMDTLFLDSQKPAQQEAQKTSPEPVQPENLLEEGKPWWAHAEDLLLSDIQLSELGFPSPSAEEGVLETQPAEALPLPENMAVLGLDCEMCQTTGGLEVARISIVDANFVKIYDELVLPSDPVTDYLTHYSGITEEKLRGVKKTFAEAQKEVLSLVRAETILVGHSLENDLRKLKISHKRVVDTVVLYPHRNGGQSKNKLSWITEVFLNKSIHNPNAPHDSTEDAEVALELVKYRLTVGEAYIYSKIGVNTRPATVPENSIIGKMARSGVRVMFTDITNSLQHFSGTECTDMIKPIVKRSDEERLKSTIEGITEGNFGFIFTRFYDVTHSYNELERATAVRDGEAEKRHMEEVHEAVRKVDGYVKEVCDAVPQTGKNLIMLIGLQGTNKTLWDMRATTKRNSPADWTKEKEEFLLAESHKAKSSFLKLMIK